MYERESRKKWDEPVFASGCVREETHSRRVKGSKREEN